MNPSLRAAELAEHDAQSKELTAALRRFRTSTRRFAIGRSMGGLRSGGSVATMPAGFSGNASRATARSGRSTDGSSSVHLPQASTTRGQTKARCLGGNGLARVRVAVGAMVAEAGSTAVLR